MTRNLTDEDVNKLIDTAWTRITSEAGKSLFKLALAGFVIICIGLAVLAVKYG